MLGDLREGLIFEVPRDEGFDVTNIAREIAIKQGLGGLQLGSGSVDVDHSEYVGVVLVVRWGVGL